MINKEDLAVEKPTISDIDGIVHLHNKHLLDNLTQEQIKEGFIRVSYDADDFRSIIDDEAIVVVKKFGKIIGYYLLGHSSNSPSLSYQFTAMNRFDLNGTKLVDLKVACGAQAVLEKEFRGIGLTEIMLSHLMEQVKTKYAYLFSSITKSNLKAIKAHTNSGYSIVGEDETKYFVCLKLQG
uniref:hypothetical protein n=1 Tax=Pedobacter schmidteae TaxID=2201271 RepID=UPI000EB07558|nr:hypothetical protein [Pedobacter schmidteae]